MYRVIADFRDIKDDSRLYRVGDTYPAKGVKVTKARIKELAKGENRYKKAFIEEIEITPAD